MLVPATRALQHLFQTIAKVDTLEELARVGIASVDFYESDGATLQVLVRAIEQRAVAIREPLRISPAPPVEPPPAALQPPAR